MAIPAKRNEKEYIKNPLNVNPKSSASYPTKSMESGLASPSARASIPTEKMPISTRLRLSSP